MSVKENKTIDIDPNLEKTDQFLMDLMLKAYDNQNERNNIIDNKSYQLITVIGVMFSLQATILSTCINGTIFSKIWFIISFIFYLISIFYFIHSINFRDFQELPSQDALVDYYETRKKHNEIINILLGNYKYFINENENILKDKIYFSKKGFYFFKLGLISTITFIFLLVI